MRHFIFILAFAAASYNLQGQTPSETIQFEERVHRFGTIREKNGKVSHTFVFQNNGKTPVKIDQIFSACGCIGNVVTKDAVKPGGKGKVTITFDPAYKSGFFSKEIMVLSNNRQNYNRIWVEGMIEPMEHPVEEDYPYHFGNGLYLRLKVMAMGYMKPGETKQMELHYANSTNEPMVLEFVPAGDAVGLKFSNPGKLAPKARGVMKVSFTMPQRNDDELLLRLQPYANKKKLAQTLDIRVLHAKKLSAKRADPAEN